jgi:transposase InsO family protein
MSKQNYYKGRRQRRRREVDEKLVVELVKEQRQQHPRMGGRKVHGVLRPAFEEAGVNVGRDKFFDILRCHDLLVKPLPKAPRTTDSRHCLPVLRNLISELEPTAPNQIWVSDLTYVRTGQTFVYVAVIMDLYSRKIVGYDCSDTLEASGCLAALEQAFSELPANRYPIHHSDRGSQYCCHAYVNRLAERDLPVSMTEQNHCYENAYAERVHGILKQEYGLGSTFRNKAQAQRAVDQAIQLYNNHRPHMSLEYRTPEEVHARAA